MSKKKLEKKAKLKEDLKSGLVSWEDLVAKKAEKSSRQQAKWQQLEAKWTTKLDAKTSQEDKAVKMDKKRLEE